MAQVKAELNNLRQSPRKVRLVADLIRGKRVSAAQNSLSFAVKKAALPFQKLLNSALANARNQNIDTENLRVKEVRVDEGATMKRYRPVAFGRSHPIKKRTSNVKIVLEVADAPLKKERKKKEEK